MRDSSFKQPERKWVCDRHCEPTGRAPPYPQRRPRESGDPSVSATALIATPRPRVSGTAANGFCFNQHLWLWVAAFAGTTPTVMGSQIQFSNSRQPSLRAQAKQSIFFHCCTKAGLLRFARNDDQTQLRDLAARFARVLPVNFPPFGIRGRRECRTLGASAAACAVVESTRVSHHGHAGNVRHSPRNGFTAYFVLSPVTGLSCHRRP